MVLWLNFAMNMFEQIMQNLETMSKDEKPKLIEATSAMYVKKENLLFCLMDLHPHIFVH
jgi:hypothetical protein